MQVDRKLSDQNFYYNKLILQKNDSLILKVSKIAFMILTCGVNLLIARYLDSFKKNVTIKEISSTYITKQNKNFRNVLLISLFSLSLLGLATYGFLRTFKAKTIIDPIKIKPNPISTEKPLSLGEAFLELEYILWIELPVALVKEAIHKIKPV